MTTVHYHRLYQISSLEMKQLCVEKSHIHTSIPPTPKN